MDRYVSTEIEARARLFDAIEGGSPFWTREIIERGAAPVVERLTSGVYDPVKFERILRGCGQLALNKF